MESSPTVILLPVAFPIPEERNHSGMRMESSPIVILLPFAFPFPDLTPTALEVPLLLLELALANFFGSFLFVCFPPKSPAAGLLGGVRPHTDTVHGTAEAAGYRWIFGELLSKWDNSTRTFIKIP